MMKNRRHLNLSPLHCSSSMMVVDNHELGSHSAESSSCDTPDLTTTATATTNHSTATTIMKEEEKICRICHENYNQYSPTSLKKNPFISPCRCTGSIKYVHRNCLNSWRHIHPTFHDNFNQCSICHTTYTVMESKASGRYLCTHRQKRCLFRFGVFITVILMFITCGFIGKTVFISLVQSQYNQFQRLIHDEQLKQLLFQQEASTPSHSLSSLHQQQQQQDKQQHKTATQHGGDNFVMGNREATHRRRFNRMRSMSNNRKASQCVVMDMHLSTFARFFQKKKKLSTNEQFQSSASRGKWNIIHEEPIAQIVEESEASKPEYYHHQQLHKQQLDSTVQRRRKAQYNPYGNRNNNNQPKRIETLAELVYACNARREYLVIELQTPKYNTNVVVADSTEATSDDTIRSSSSSSPPVKVYQRIVGSSRYEGLFTVNPSQHDLIIDQHQYQQCLRIWSNNVHHLSRWIELWHQNYYRLNLAHFTMSVLTMSFIGVFHMLFFWRAYFDMYLLNIVTNRFGVNQQQTMFFGIYHIESHLFTLFVVIGLIKFVMLLQAAISLVGKWLNVDMSAMEDDIVLDMAAVEDDSIVRAATHA